MMMTQTPSPGGDSFSYPVLRQPSLRALGKAAKWCDVFWQNNLSLRTIWPAWPLRKPIVITHQGSYCRRPSGLDLVQRLKHAIIGRTTSIAISEAVAACFAFDSTVIHNPYDARRFTFDLSSEERSADLIFVGRLVSEKGIDILLKAVAILRTRRLFPCLTIVGAGPELTDMEQLASTLGLNDQVKFAGAKRGSELITLLRRHKILVVPSRYNEPFGVVALEGIASKGGGLPEAIEPCGLTFQNGDVNALAQALETLLLLPNDRARLLAQAPRHLAKFHPATIAEAYLGLFRSKLA